MGTDRWAYRSRLRAIDPLAKLWLTLGALVVCLGCGSAGVGLATLALLSAYIVVLGGQPVKTVVKCLLIPLAFLLAGSVTLVLRPLGEGAALWAVSLPVLGRWGVSVESLALAGTVLCRAMGAAACLFFLALNTPVCDLTAALGRLHAPALLVELMELIYRFLFVLSGEAGRIHTAQAARLGYGTWRRSITSLGELLSVLFVRALRRGERVYAALESRYYTGSLATVAGQYEKGTWLYGLLLATAAVQIFIWTLERGGLSWMLWR